MFLSRQVRVGMVAVALALVFPAAGAQADVTLRNVSLDKPLILNQNTSYNLENVSVVGITDAAALTLTGPIQSITIRRGNFGNVWAGTTGKACGIDCAGATVGSLVATDTNFYNAENQIVCLREGSFGRVVFQHCTFRATEPFLKEMYARRPWRDWPPVTEFYNIDRLELLDNEYTNTIVVIHPSVKQVVFRGVVPRLQVQDPDSTQVLRLGDGDVSEAVSVSAAGEGRFFGLAVADLRRMLRP